jgi:hypothetical protein
MYRQYVQSVPFVVIMCLVTCGIYTLIWIYQTSKLLRDYTADPSITPTADLLLCIFTCGIYQLFWFYKLGQRIQSCGSIAQVAVNDNSMIYLLLSLFGMGVAAAAIAQSDLNRVWETA